MTRIKVISALLALLLLCSCGQKENNIKTPLLNATVDEVISDGGVAAKMGNWIYYINGDNFTRENGERFHEYAGALCRMKEDGSEKDVVVDRDVSVFNIDGEYIYLCVYSSSKSSIARVKIDGSDYRVLKNIDDIYYGGCYGYTSGYIYYTKNYRLCRINSDGTGEKQLTDFKVYNLRVGEDYSYFTREENQSIGTAYRIKNGENDFFEVANDPSYILKTGNPTYYYMLSNKKVYQYSEEDFSSTAVIHSGFSEYVFFDTGYGVSYSEADDKTGETGIYYIPTGGGTKVKLSDNCGKCMAYKDGYIYYINSTKLNYLYRCAIDGSIDECVCEEYVFDYDNLDIVENYLYFLSDSDEDRIYRINIETLKTECIELEGVSVIG